MDVTENENAYRGARRNPRRQEGRHQHRIDGNQVEISAEVKNEKEVKDGESVLRSERYYGKVYRAFTLGQDGRRERDAGQVRRRRARADAAEEGRGPAKRITIQ